MDDAAHRRGRHNRLKNRLVNVRLDPERVRKAQVLRERGHSLSDVVRDAIDQKYEALEHPNTLRSPRDVDAMMKRIYEKYPEPPDLPPLEYDVHDRRAAADAIRRKLRAKKE